MMWYNETHLKCLFTCASTLKFWTIIAKYSMSSSLCDTNTSGSQTSFSLKGQNHLQSELWAVRVHFLVEGHFSVLMKTILQNPPGSRTPVTILLCWKTLCGSWVVQRGGRGGGSPGIATWHTCPRIRLIGSEQGKSLLFTGEEEEAPEEEEGDECLQNKRHVSGSFLKAPVNGPFEHSWLDLLLKAS